MQASQSPTESNPALCSASRCAQRTIVTTMCLPFDTAHSETSYRLRHIFGVHQISSSIITLVWRMSLLVALPEVITHSILDEWLGSRYIGRMDSAHCNKKERRDFLSVLGKLTVLSTRLDTLSRNSSSLRWIQLKGIRFQRICVHWKALSDKLLVVEALLSYHMGTLRALDFMGNLDIIANTSNVERILAQSGDLDSIFIERVCFSRKTISLLVGNNRTLRKLELMECEFLSRAACAAIATGCPNLEVLDLRMTDVDDIGLKTIMRSCSKIRELELFACENITDKGIIEVVSRNGQKLTHLSISDTSATEASIVAIAKSCPLLMNLNLERVPVVTPRCAATVGKGCPLLENLSFVGCGAVLDDALVAVAQGCPKMKHLFLSECERITEVGLHALATLPALRYVGISARVGCRFIEAVQAFPSTVKVHLDPAGQPAPWLQQQQGEADADSDAGDQAEGPVQEEGVEQGSELGQEDVESAVAGIETALSLGGPTDTQD